MNLVAAFIRLDHCKDRLLGQVEKTIASIAALGQTIYQVPSRHGALFRARQVNILLIHLDSPPENARS